MSNITQLNPVLSSVADAKQRLEQALSMVVMIDGAVNAHFQMLNECGQREGFAQEIKQITFCEVLQMVESIPDLSGVYDSLHSALDRFMS